MALSKEAFRAAVQELWGGSQQEAARALKSDDRTIRRWLSGERSIPGPVEALVDLMMSDRSPPAAAPGAPKPLEYCCQECGQVYKTGEAPAACRRCSGELKPVLAPQPIAP